MKKRYIILLLLALSGIGVFSYNYWSYSCGRCNVDSLLSLSTPAIFLIGINAIALMALLSLKMRNRYLHEPLRCACGAPLMANWLFCPKCGLDQTKTP